MLILTFVVILRKERGRGRKVSSNNNNKNTNLMRREGEMWAEDQQRDIQQR
jgi:hypothetical protein